MRVFALIAFLFFFFTAANSLFAADISFSNSTTTFQKDQEVSLDVTLTGVAANTTNYIRAAFFHSDSPTSYFGQVFNHSNSWYNGTPSPIDAKQFLQVQINSEGSWSGQLKVKPDTQSPYFKGNGIYFLKVGRYTASATSVSNWSEAKQIEIQGVLPTPTPTLKPSPTERPSNTPRPVKSSTANTATPTVFSKTEEMEEELFEEEDPEDGVELAVLGATIKPTRSDTSPTPEVRVANASNTFSLFLISGAVILIIGCGILLVSAYRKQKAEEI